MWCLTTTARAKIFLKNYLTNLLKYDILIIEREEKTMTKKELEKAIYINESKKKRKEKANQNRQTWVGVRSAVFEDKKKYNRKKFKKALDKELDF